MSSFKHLGLDADIRDVGIRLRERTKRLDADQGFTLVEVMVALAIATSMFLALAYGAIASVRGSQVARQNQQAADLANQQVEQVRQMGWGALGLATVACPDDRLTNCGSAAKFNGEPLVIVIGGLASQKSQTTINNVTYDINTYVSKPADTTGNYRRVTVIVQWEEYGQVRTRTATTLVSQSTRGLPLPDFKLTPIGAVNVQVNPGATAFWGFSLTNQGAPDQWNLLSSGDIQPTFYQDNGDDVFNPSTDIVQLTDSNGDGAVDTGRLEPQGSIHFWAIYQVPGNATDGQRNLAITAKSASQPNAPTASATVALTLTVTTGVITGSPTPTPTTTPTGPTSTATPTPTGTALNPTCADPNPAPTPAGAAGYSVIANTLHNSGTPAWPAIPLPASDPIPGSVALKPMTMNLAGNAIPSGRALPVLSTNLSPANTPGRILYPGGSFGSDASKVADWVTASPSKTYTGSIVLRTYVATVGGSEADIRLGASVYEFRSSGNKAYEKLTAPEKVVSGVGCNGFRKVSISFSISGTMPLQKNYVLGVRVWNTDPSTSIRLAYDHADYPSTLTVVEK